MKNIWKLEVNGKKQTTIILAIFHVFLFNKYSEVAQHVKGFIYKGKAYHKTCFKNSMPSRFFPSKYNLSKN